MYETFFQMDHTPFSRATPVADLYESPAMSDTLGRLAYAADRQLFAVVTADAGCGKSTLIRRFVTSLPKEEYLFLYLSDSKLTPRWFYKGMLDQLGIESKFYRGDAKRSGSSRRKWRSSAASRRRKWSASWMRPIFWRRRPLMSFAFS